MATIRRNFSDIARELTESIASGRYPVGSILPGELELSDMFGTSRHTIRAALAELQHLGLVSRKKNAGTRVESAVARNEFRPSLGSVDDLVQFGSNNIRQVQDVTAVDVSGELAKTLGSPAGRRWLRISSIRVESGNRNPLGWTDVYIDPDYHDLIDDVRASPDTLISTLIERRYGRRVVEIRQIIRSVLIRGDVAKALGVTEGGHGLEILRHYLDSAGQLMEISLTVHPADRFVVSMRMHRSAP